MNRRCRFSALPVLWFGLAFLVFQLIFVVGYIPTTSMEPTIKSQTIILGMRGNAKLEQGDIVIFKRDGQTMVKRIAACPGDTVYECRGIYLECLGKCDGQSTPIVVPEHSYFMLGDNEQNSHDSRFWYDDPFVHKRDVVGKALIY